MNEQPMISLAHYPLAQPIPQHMHHGITDLIDDTPSGKLRSDVALITGGDSRLGRVIALAFAQEGADIVLLYQYDDRTARATQNRIEATGQRCLLLKGDVGDKAFCNDAVEYALEHYERLDILVNNACEVVAMPAGESKVLTQWENSFRTNIFSMFHMVQAALPYLKGSGRIINTASLGEQRIGDIAPNYSATKGAIVSFTRSLAKALSRDGVRVNAVAPNLAKDQIAPTDDQQAHEAQIAAYLFLAAHDSAYITGEVMHAGYPTVPDQ